MIYDCFPFFNEIDILKIRLNVLNDVVDKFVLCEGTQTFSGLDKPLYYEENKELFKEFEDKIIHVVCDDFPDIDMHAKDTWQKDACTRGLVNCTDDDIILCSDLDEIPDPTKIKEILDNGFNPDEIYHFTQRFFYCYLNTEDISGKLLAYAGDFPDANPKKWLGTRMLSYKLMREQNLKVGDLRLPEQLHGIRIDNGGWHFSYIGGTGVKSVKDRMQEKLQAAAHQEMNKKTFLDNADSNIKDGKDIFGREAHFVRCEIDETYPQYIRDHIKDFDYLILKEEKTGAKVWRKITRGIANGTHDFIISCKRLGKRILKK